MQQGGEWLLPAPEQRPEQQQRSQELRVHGSSGSMWSTPEERRANGYREPDANPSNLFVLSRPEAPPGSWEATITARPQEHGEQAGLYAFAGLDSWVKLVIEADSAGGVGLVFAEQQSGKPFVRAKKLLASFDGQVALRLVVQPKTGTVSGFWRYSGSDSWKTVRLHA